MKWGKTPFPSFPLPLPLGMTRRQSHSKVILVLQPRQCNGAGTCCCAPLDTKGSKLLVAKRFDKAGALSTKYSVLTTADRFC